MAYVYYRFRSAKLFESMPIEGPFITIKSLKQMIFEFKRMEKGTDYDLLVSDAQTNEEYVDEDAVVFKNTAVLIRRVPGLPRKPIVVERDESGPCSVSPIVKQVNAEVQGGFARKTPPTGYVCYRCRVPGHFIQHCPTNCDPNYDVKSGAAAPLKQNESSFNKERGLASTRHVGDLMPELCCPLCKEVMQDAVFATKCCFGSFCEKCIRQRIITKSMCVCGATNILEDDLVPNKTLRDTITRILGSATSGTSSESVGSLSLVQDKESTRDVQPKVPSPTQSDTSRDQWISMPPLIDHSSDVKVGEDAWKGNIVKDEMHCLDAKATISEDVQEKMFGVAQWESFQDFGAKAYSGMPLVYDPYEYMAPFGGMQPQDPFTAQCYIMSALLPRDLSELAVNSIGMNQGSRIEFGSQKAEIKKRHKIEPCNERNGHSPAKRRRFSNDHQDEDDLKDGDGSSCKKRRLSLSSLRMDRGHEIISCT